MYSGEEIGGGGDNAEERKGGDHALMRGANFVEQKVIQDAVFAPLLKLADYLDCLVSDVTAIVKPKGQRAGRFKSCCRKFLGSPSFVLVYLSLLFSGALLYVYNFKNMYTLSFGKPDFEKGQTISISTRDNFVTSSVVRWICPSFSARI